MRESTSQLFAERRLAATPSRFWYGLARRSVIQVLEKLERGQLVLVENGERHSFGEPGEDGLTSTVAVYHPRAYWELAWGGTTGGARAYMNGWWSTRDLSTLIRIVIRNRSVLFGMEKGWAWLGQRIQAVGHFLRKNTRRGSRRNIESHYDLGNDFFSSFLDDTMSYSCGIFVRGDASLEQAATAKYDLVCRKLDLGPQDRLLEIGGGWGGLAIHAARHYGCSVTTTTISPSQYELAVRRVRQAGLSHRVRVLRRDYRDLGGRYDKLVSIEMLEAVGHQFYDTYFRVCSRLLQPGGKMLLQTIVAPDEEFQERSRTSDFVKEYIFPGCTLPSVGVIRETIARSTDLELTHLEDITPHYVVTLRRWRENLWHHVDEVRRLGYSDHFVRMWDYYFAYCEAGFQERHNGDVQILFSKGASPAETPSPAPGNAGS